MDPKIFFITLAVDDLDRSLAFYRDGLGWPTEGIVGREFQTRSPAPTARAMFTLDGGLLLALYERANLPKDASLAAAPPSSTEFSLGIPAESRAEVDRMLAQAGLTATPGASKLTDTGRATTLSAPGPDLPAAQTALSAPFPPSNSPFSGLLSEASTAIRPGTARG